MGTSSAHACQCGDFFDEGFRRNRADWDILRARLLEGALQILRRSHRDFRVKQDVEVGFGKPDDVRRRGSKRGDDIDADAHAFEKACDLLYVIPVAETERRRAKKIADRALVLRALLPALRVAAGAHHAVKCLGCPPVFLLLVGRKFKRNDRDRQIKRFSQSARIVLDQFRRAG